MKILGQDTIETSPFRLVSLAYQGGLRSQGIPSHGTLITAHRNRQISALDLIHSAVALNQLPSALINQEYLKAVENGFLFYYLSHPRSKSTKKDSPILRIVKRVQSLTTVLFS